MFSDDLGAMYARLPGDAWTLGGGFAVVRGKTSLTGPMSFLSSADDKDKANVPWVLLAGVVVGAASHRHHCFTLLEHTSPLKELVMQAERLKSGRDGQSPGRPLPWLVSARRAETSIKGWSGPSGRPAASRESPPISSRSWDPLRPSPSMSAFSFPMAPGASDGVAVPQVPLHAASSPVIPAAGMPAGPPLGAAASVAFDRERDSSGRRPDDDPLERGSRALPRVSALLRRSIRPSSVAAPQAAPADPAPVALAPNHDDDGDEDATMVGAVPAELLAQATGESRAASEEAADWLSVYEDFLRTKKQCGEPTDGLTFDKFSHTLKKNRDALISKHGCKRVKFSVYVKEGRASLKATPVRE